MGDLANLFGAGSSSDTRQRDPFGSIPYGIAGQLRNQIGPMLAQLGFGGGNPRQQARRQHRLDTATGPLATAIRDIRDLTPNVYGEAQAAGERVASVGSQAFTDLHSQINNLLQSIQGATGEISGVALPGAEQALGMAEQFGRTAFDPVSSTPFFNEATRRAVMPIRGEFAARGLEGGGGELAAETRARSDLTENFAQQQLGLQAQAPGIIGSAASNVGNIAGLSPELQNLGVGAAGAELSAVPQLAQALTAQFGIPMEALGGLVSLLTGGQQGGLGLLGATSPQYTSFGGPVGPFGIKK